MIELNEKVMKIEIAQEMMKLDFKSELEVLKLSIKDEFQKLLGENENSANKDFLKFLNDFITYLNKSRNFLQFKSKIYKFNF